MSDTSPYEFDRNDPLVAAWNSQQPSDGPVDLAANIEELADTVASAHRRDQRHLWWLNIREILPALFVAATYAGLSPGAQRPALALVAALLALFVGGFLLVSSLRHHRADQRWDASVRGQLERRVAQLEHRSWMYRNLAWWYFLPLLTSSLLVVYALGGTVGNRFVQIYVPLIMVYSAIAYRKARRNGRIRYELENERLRAVLHEFDGPT